MMLNRQGGILTFPGLRVRHAGGPLTRSLASEEATAASPISIPA